MQLVADIIPGVDPSQFVSSVLKDTLLLYLINIVYDNIGLPPSKGAIQVIVTPVFETTDVSGVYGVFGTAAALTITWLETTLKPTKVLD